jgi:hypothetical protein
MLDVPENFREHLETISLNIPEAPPENLAKSAPPAQPQQTASAVDSETRRKALLPVQDGEPREVQVRPMQWLAYGTSEWMSQRSSENTLRQASYTAAVKEAGGPVAVTRPKPFLEMLAAPQVTTVDAEGNLSHDLLALFGEPTPLDVQLTSQTDLALHGLAGQAAGGKVEMNLMSNAGVQLAAPSSQALNMMNDAGAQLVNEIGQALHGLDRQAAADRAAIDSLASSVNLGLMMLTTHAAQANLESEASRIAANDRAEHSEKQVTQLQEAFTGMMAGISQINEHISVIAVTQAAEVSHSSARKNSLRPSLKARTRFHKREAQLADKVSAAAGTSASSADPQAQHTKGDMDDRCYSQRCPPKAAEEEKEEESEESDNPPSLIYSSEDEKDPTQRSSKNPNV